MTEEGGDFELARLAPDLVAARISFATLAGPPARCHHSSCFCFRALRRGAGVPCVASVAPSPSRDTAAVCAADDTGARVLYWRRRVAVYDVLNALVHYGVGRFAVLNAPAITRQASDAGDIKGDIERGLT